MGNKYSLRCMKNNLKNEDLINENIPPQYYSNDSPLNQKIKSYHFTCHRSIYKGKVKMEDLKTFRSSLEENNNESPNSVSVRNLSASILSNSRYFETLKEEDKKSIQFEYQNDLKEFLQMKTKKYGTVREDLKKENISLEMHYTLLEKIYKEIPGMIKKALSLRDNKIYEIQIIPKSKIERSIQFISEIGDFMKIKHENIIPIIDFLHDQDNYYIIKEFFNCFDFLEVLNNTPNYCQQDIHNIFLQIISALKFTCKNKQYHGEISFSCLFFEKNNINSKLLIDNFVVPKYYKIEASGFQTSIAQIFYAPEKMNKHIISEKVDVWSCGVLLYYLCSGQQPFTGTSEEDYERRLVYGIIKFPKTIWSTISGEIIILIKLMLAYAPEKRIYFENILDHSWIKSQSPEKEKRKLLYQAIDNLKETKAQIQFQSNILKLIAQKLISKEEEKAMRLKFIEFDENGDGILSKNELIKGYSEILKDKEKAIIEVSKVLHYRGEANKESINYNEFILTQIDLNSKDLDKNIKQAFDTFHINQNGYIPLDELLKILGGSSSNFVLKNQIKKALHTKSELIDFDKFKIIVLSLLNKT